MNKNRLRKEESKKSPRLRGIDKSESTRITDLEITLKYLDEAAKYLNKHLNGKNHLGLITNIKNSSYEIKKHLKQINK
jgi:hypothetical protein